MLFHNTYYIFGSISLSRLVLRNLTGHFKYSQEVIFIQALFKMREEALFQFFKINLFFL